MNQTLVKVRVQAVRYEATEILSFRLHSMEHALPEWTPGSHIDVHLPNGFVRSYSLSNAVLDEDEYRITVQRDVASRGGSRTMHDDLRVGEIVDISLPRNNFEVCETAPHSLFIAGGIGVTPFLPMIRHLNTLGRPWTLHYSVRTPDRAAHLEELQDFTGSGIGRLEMNYDGLPGGKMLDLDKILGEAAPDTHVYCCGPQGMLDAYRRAASAHFPEEQVHFEYFTAEVEIATGGGYVVSLAKSGKEVRVEEGESLLQALIAAGVDVDYSCEEGVCGTCEIRVLAGIPDHRDMILSERERAENKTMMVCCSGSKSDLLVLDL